MDVSLIHGWLPIVVQLLAGAVVVAAVGQRSRRWLLRVLPVGVVAGIVVAGLVYWFIQFQALADDAAPLTLWLWLLLTGLALVVAVAGWLGARWWTRAASVVAIPLCILCAALSVNVWTGYLPTVSSAFGRATGAALPSQTDLAGAMDMRKRHQTPAKGVLVSVPISGDASGFPHREELVYLPPAWFAGDSVPALPAVLMIGGEFGHPDDWPVAGGAQRAADEFAAAHGGNAPVLVFTDTSGQFSNDTECVNGLRGNAADHLTKDVVPYVVSQFGVSPDPAHWGIVGWSAGGTCALMTTVMHPQMFSTFVDMDGQIGPTAGSKDQTIARLFGGDATAFAAFDPTAVMREHGPYTGVAGWFAVSEPGSVEYHAAGSGPPPAQGADDVDPEDHLAVARYLCPLASSVGIECAVVPKAGGHDLGSAGAVFAEALPWLAGRLGTPSVPAIPLPGAPPA